MTEVSYTFNQDTQHSRHAAWVFEVVVIVDDVRHTFNAHTNMTWRDFIEKAHQHIDHDEVRLGYRLCGDRSAMSSLTCEFDWLGATGRVSERAVVARTRAVAMEIKNMVSDDTFDKRQLTDVLLVLADTGGGAEGTRHKGKGKRKGKAQSQRRHSPRDPSGSFAPIAMHGNFGKTSGVSNTLGQRYSEVLLDWGRIADVRRRPSRVKPRADDTVGEAYGEITFSMHNEEETYCL